MSLRLSDRQNYSKLQEISKHIISDNQNDFNRGYVDGLFMVQQVKKRTSKGKERI
jgi:hypothetical protein